MADVVERKNLKYWEAIAYARSRRVVLPAEYYGALIGLQRSQSFSVAGLASIAQITHILDKLDDVLKDGKTFKDFQAAVKDGSLDIKLPAHRLDNIFRTNIQAAYARGRWEQQTKVKATRPFLMYDAINDGRTRPAHSAMDGTILHRDHPWWKTHYPPNGYRCRCTVISLTEAQAKKRGISAAPPLADADDGWEYNPGEDYQPAVTKQIDKAIQHKGLAAARAALAAKRAAGLIQKKAVEAKVTLDSVMEKGRKAMRDIDEASGAPLATDRWMEELDKMLVKRLGLTPQVGSLPSSMAVRERAKKHFNAFHSVEKPSDMTDTDYHNKALGALSLPASWLKAVQDYYGAVGLKHSLNRAHAQQNRATAYLQINWRERDVVLHEFVHLVQIAKPELQKLAEEMHARRTAGAKHKRLKDIYPNSNYGPDEIVKEDQYFNPYVGREYMSSAGDGLSRWKPFEILSMAAQSLVGDLSRIDNKWNAARKTMFYKDRETAEFILGLFLSYD